MFQRAQFSFLFRKTLTLSSKATDFILCPKGENKTGAKNITQTNSKNPREGRRETIYFTTHLMRPVCIYLRSSWEVFNLVPVVVDITRAPCGYCIQTTGSRMAKFDTRKEAFFKCHPKFYPDCLNRLTCFLQSLRMNGSLGQPQLVMQQLWEWKRGVENAALQLGARTLWSPMSNGLSPLSVFHLFRVPVLLFCFVLISF